MPMGQPVTLHDDEILDLAYDRLAAEPFVPEYGHVHRECPGCALLVHHAFTTDHPGRCAALRALVTWEASDGRY